MAKERPRDRRAAGPKKRNSAVGKLPCGGHRSEDRDVTSPTTSTTKGKIPRKKTLRDHCDFDRRLCGADHKQKTKKLDRRSHRRAELDASSVRRVPWRPVFRGHFRSQGKEIRV